MGALVLNAHLEKPEEGRRQSGPLNPSDSSLTAFVAPASSYKPMEAVVLALHHGRPDLFFA